MIDDNTIYLMNRIGYELNKGPRTGWYSEGVLCNSVNYMTALKMFHNKWSHYFKLLGKNEDFDFDDWTSEDERMWLVLREVEEILFGDDESKYTHPFE